jgi:two-component system chemotaxis response regulator CheY
MSQQADPHGLRAVIADDEAFIRQVLQNMLRRLGIEVVGVAETGLQTLALYREHRPDLVVLDIAMPEMDGMETLRRLLAMDPEARVLVCTSFSSQQYVVEALKVGAKGYLSKPFDLERIREKISKICGDATGS